MKNSILPFIEDNDFEDACKIVISKLNEVSRNERNLYANVLDPFSAIFETAYNNISLSEWQKSEQRRQIQKSWQNSIGTFHQALIGHIADCEDLETGEVVDIKSQKLKLIAEVKNKWNTTKGNHKKNIYDDLDTLLKQPKYKGFTGYYVAILTKHRIDKPFMPSDNASSKTRINEKIRIIDGKTFYKLITGRDDALEMIYKALVQFIYKIKPFDKDKILNDKLFMEFFNQATKK